MKSIECDSDPLFCGTFNCKMVPINRTRSQITVYCQLLKPIKDATVSVIFETKNSKNIYSTWLNTTHNYCESIGKDRADLFGFADKVLRKLDPNMVKNCPIKVSLYN